MSQAKQASRGLQFDEPSIFERGAPGRSAVSVPPLDVPAVDLQQLLGDLLRKEPASLPEVSEPEVVRHFTRLSQWNFSIDTNFYPLGSCTMKHNPRVNEWAARLPGFANLHPYMPVRSIQGALQLMSSLRDALAEVCGMDDCSLQPAAGAQGELTGLMMVRSYHQSKGRSPKKVLIPDTAHGTNAASCTLNGFTAVPFAKGGGADGVCDPNEVAKLLEMHGDDVACVMITNPNTLGLFETHLPKIADLVHARGGLVYGDGANLNAIMGRVRPGDLGIDVMQFNLHKTFTTPHGGGGPGCGPVAFKALLSPFQPGPVVVKKQGKQGDYFALDDDRPQSIGRVRSFFGNFGMMVRAYTYIREMGPDGLKSASELAVLNANYLAARIKEFMPIAFDRICMHEAIFSDRDIKRETGVMTLDIAKRLIDYGFHPPTVYFPLVVAGALMMEPTETESKQTLDEFVEALRAIQEEAKQTPDLVKKAPHETRLARLDEARAARKPVLRYQFTADVHPASPDAE